MPLDVSEFNGILVLKKVPKIPTFYFVKIHKSIRNKKNMMKTPATEIFQNLEFFGQNWLFSIVWLSSKATQHK